MTPLISEAHSMQIFADMWALGPHVPSERPGGDAAWRASVQSAVGGTAPHRPLMGQFVVHRLRLGRLSPRGLGRLPTGCAGSGR